MAHPNAPEPGEDFASWIRPHLEPEIDRLIAETRERVAGGELLSQQDQLHVLDQLIKDRRERAALIEASGESRQ